MFHLGHSSSRAGCGESLSLGTPTAYGRRELRGCRFDPVLAAQKLSLASDKPLRIPSAHTSCTGCLTGAVLESRGSPFISQGVQSDCRYLMGGPSSRKGGSSGTCLCLVPPTSSSLLVQLQLPDFSLQRSAEGTRDLVWITPMWQNMI